MIARVLIVHRDDKRLEVQHLWTSAMLRARGLALQTTSDCISAIAVRNQDTTLTSVVPHAHYQKQFDSNERDDRPFAKMANERGSNVVAKLQQQSGP